MQARTVRRVFLAAAGSGALSLGPFFALESKVASAAGGLLVHPDHYYGFLVVALVWQAAFWMIATDVQRFRPLIPIAATEKLGYAVMLFALWVAGRTDTAILFVAAIELAWGAAFVACFAGSVASKENDSGIRPV
jgi:hypothetical protein